MLDNGASDGGEKELGGEGKVVKFGDFDGFHFAEVVGVASKFTEKFAGGPGDLTRGLINCVRNCLHVLIIAWSGVI